MPKIRDKAGSRARLGALDDRASGAVIAEAADPAAALAEGAQARAAQKAAMAEARAAALAGFA